MNASLPPLIDALAGLRVLVLGEAMLDSYLEGSTGRLCQEAPVPVVMLSERRDMPGGAANTAVNVSSLGGRATFVSVVGQDEDGNLLRQILNERGVATEDILSDPARRTLAKRRVIAKSQILLRLDQGSTEPIGAAAEQALIDRLAEIYPQCEAVIVSDYAYGVITPRIIRALADLQARWSRVLVADSRRLAIFREVGLTAVKPNYKEAVELLEAGVLDAYRVRAEGIAQYGDRILELTGAQIAAVTLDSEGALIFERGCPVYRTFAEASRHACVAGAGDTFVSALALALAAGAPTCTAAELASSAAAVVVGKDRTAICEARELREYVSAEGKSLSNLARLADRVDYYRQQGRRIVFTNGCYDILHRGHITFLNRAKALGDVLIVGVNSDDSIHRLKGPDRPINSLEDRVQVLAALSCVDYLISFDEDTPCNVIRVVRPDVFVKGGDYTRDRLVEAPLVEELGGVVQILPYLQERSTSGIIARIREKNAWPEAVQSLQRI
ncbi:MAG: D-glycero-beta-D-manno-heptose 1-phosphate adenylyltransferase [Gemmataceae bacterium]